MAGSDEALFDFSLRMQEACTVGEASDQYLASVPDLIPAESYALYQLDPRTGTPIECIAHAPDTFLEEYENLGRDDDPVLEAALRDQAPRDQRLAANEHEWRATGACEVLRRAGLVHSLEAPVRVSGEVAGTLNFARTADQPAFTEHDLHRAARASQIVGAALQRAARFDTIDRRAGLLTDVLDQLDTALVISSLDGEQLYLNDAAQTAIDQADRPLINAAAPAVRQALEQLRRRRDNHTASAQHTLELSDYHAETSARAVRLLANDELVLTFLGHRPIEEAREVPPPEGTSHSDRAMLSSRELEVAELVARGLTTGEMSRELFISQNTVKQHLKRMFQKLEVHNRAQLVAALWNPESSSEDHAS